MRRAILITFVCALGLGSIVGLGLTYTKPPTLPPSRASVARAALQAAESARLEAMSACAEYAQAVDWGTEKPDTKTVEKCFGLFGVEVQELPTAPAPGPDPDSVRL